MAASSFSSSSQRATFSYDVFTTVSCREHEFQRITALVRHDMDQQALQRSFSSVPAKLPQKRQHYQRGFCEKSLPGKIKEVQCSDEKNVGVTLGASEQLSGIQRLLIQQNRQIMQLVSGDSLESTLQQQLFRLIRLDPLNDAEDSLESGGYYQTPNSATQETYAQPNGACNPSSRSSVHLPGIKWLQESQGERFGDKTTNGKAAAPSKTVHRKRLGFFVQKKSKEIIERTVANMPNSKSRHTVENRSLSKNHIKNQPEGTPKSWPSCKLRHNILSLEAAHTKNHAPKCHINHTDDDEEEKDKKAAEQNKVVAEWKESALHCVSRLQAYEEELKLRWLTPEAPQCEGNDATNNPQIGKTLSSIFLEETKQEQGSKDYEIRQPLSSPIFFGIGAYSEKHWNSDYNNIHVSTSMASKAQMLSERLTEDIVDEVIGEITKELNSLCDEYVEHLYQIEFLDPDDSC
ncbi:hypothetical protein O6H91_17G080700 [Diphasiastrum complanatum]|uniref:Uncharacterized protein n=1 Tax=Diphasiastrum complanatum TaxID=34168 RepID=A0ACC2B8P2_DIPCM|nr:hypothetical protein O6H91_17G080700 [Diphasiastrum complanatum]